MLEKVESIKTSGIAIKCVGGLACARPFFGFCALKIILRIHGC